MFCIILSAWYKIHMYTSLHTIFSFFFSIYFWIKFQQWNVEAISYEVRFTKKNVFKCDICTSLWLYGIWIYLPVHGELVDVYVNVYDDWRINTHFETRMENMLQINSTFNALAENVKKEQKKTKTTTKHIHNHGILQWMMRCRYLYITPFLIYAANMYLYIFCRIVFLLNSKMVSNHQSAISNHIVKVLHVEKVREYSQILVFKQNSLR